MPLEPFDSDYDTPAESPGFLLWQVSNLWQRRQRAVLKQVNLTHVQFVLLAGLAWLSRVGPERSEVTQVQLAEHAQVDVMMTSQVLRALVQKGLIERTPHPRDTRANLLQVTPEGLNIVRRAMRLVERTDHAFFAALGNDVAGFIGELQCLLPAEASTARNRQTDA